MKLEPENQTVKRMVKEDVKGVISTWREARRELRGPIRLAELALLAQSLHESIAALQTGPVSCRKGCGACCRQVVPLSPPEAYLLKERVQAMPEAGQAVLHERFAKVAQGLENGGLGDSPLFSMAADYFRLDLDCPFLVDESCSIHAMRPLACREHLVVSPMVHCGSFPNVFVRMQWSPLSVGDALSQLTAECLGAPMEMIPLLRGLRWVQENPEPGERAWEAEWLLDRLVALCFERLEFSAPPP
jgi:Fe-S-cluster containining protein